MTIEHPNDAALATGDAAVQDHVAACSRCQARAQAATVPIPTTDGDLVVVEAVPHVVAAMAGIPDFDRDPAPGEIWRLEFDGVAAPAVVAERTADELVVWGVGEDIEYAESATVILNEGALGFPVGVWTTLEVVVPRFTAERFLGTVDDATLGRLRQVSDRVRSGRAGGGDGAAFTSDLDPRLVYREELSVPLHRFAALAELVAREPEQPRSLRPLLAEAELRGPDLRRLGFEPDEVAALRDDKLWLDAAEIGRLAVAAELPAQYVAEASPQPPVQLVVALHTPPRRRQVAETAARYGVAEHTERRQAVRQIWAMEMRTSGSGSPDWDAAIDDYFASR